MTEPMALPARRRPPRVPRRAQRRSHGMPHERVRIIEFIWVSPTGVQPVLLVDREYLH